MNSINNNLVSANAAGSLAARYSGLAASVERLSSGLRINSAADDAAGLAIRELMRSNVASLYQGMRNAQDAVSMLQVADGALSVIDEKLVRMKELAEQAATGTYDSTQRLMIHSEFVAMGDEIDRIARATDFNGIKLLDGSLAGAHDGSGLTSKGKMKIHFGQDNDSAEDYYHIEIPDATLAGLFRDAGLSRAVLGFDPIVEDKAVPNRGDDEGQNILALPNGNMLIMSNVHTDRSLRLFEYDPQGNLIHESRVPGHPGSTGVMQPKQAIVLPDNNVAVAFNSWGDDAVAFVVYDSSWNVVSNIAIPAGGSIGGPEDLAMSATPGSILAGGAVNGNIVMAMTDAAGSAPLITGNTPAGTITLGPGSGAVSTVLDGRHFVVVQHGANLEGYFVDDGGNVSSTALCAGSNAKIASFGNQAILVYSHADPDTGRTSSYGRLVRSDGTTGAEFQLNDPDAANDNSVIDIQIMKDPDGNDLEQVLVAWKNSANNGTLMAEAFVLEGEDLVTSGNGDMVFVEGITGNGLGPANIAVLADGSIAADWQRDLSTQDDNAFSVFKVRWGSGGKVDLDISTQDKAQKMLVSVTKAMVAKDKIRASLGAFSNRLENSITALSIQAENLQAAESRISDADVSLEMMNLVKNQIISQSAAAMLGQANSYPHMLAKLLNGP